MMKSTKEKCISGLLKFNNYYHTIKENKLDFIAETFKSVWEFELVNNMRDLSTAIVAEEEKDMIHFYEACESQLKFIEYCIDRKGILLPTPPFIIDN